MMKNKPVLLIILLLICSTLQSCTLDGHWHSSVPDFTENIVMPTLTCGENLEDPTLSLILQTMYMNKEVCQFNVPAKEDVDIDNWLSVFPGLQGVQCEYTILADSCNVTAHLEYWDNYPLVYAYKTSRTEQLNSRQMELYRRYCEILSQITSASNSAVDNERAVHDYLINNITYVDTKEYTHPAYDALFTGEAVCGGYTECFQTFMDMLGIPCRPVFGNTNTGNHIWNMVMLDKEWYHVDVTWDDPVTKNGIDTPRYSYFNITTSDISTDHAITSQVPDAAGSRYAYYNVLSYPLFRTQNELNEHLRAAMQARVSQYHYRYSGYGLNPQYALEHAGIGGRYSLVQTKRPDYTTVDIYFQYD